MNVLSKHEKINYTETFDSANAIFHFIENTFVTSIHFKNHLTSSNCQTFHVISYGLFKTLQSLIYLIDFNFLAHELQNL
jgi:hypothetical protein